MQIDEDQGPMPEGDYGRLEMERDRWRKQYRALEPVAYRTLQALQDAGRYLWHKPDAAQTQPCYDWCPKCQLEKARSELLNCLATMVPTREPAGEEQLDEVGNEQGVAGADRRT